MLSRKSSSRPPPVHGGPAGDWLGTSGSFGAVGGARWRGEEGEDGEGGSVWSGAREGSGLTFKPGISEEMRGEDEW